MKYTLLEMVQTILSSMDSDEVETISDTPESYQVAVVIRTAYMDIVSRPDLPEHFDLVQLTETDSTTPVKMTVPDEVANIQWLKYNKETIGDTNLQMRAVIYKPLPDFLEMMYMIPEDGSNVETFSETIGNATVPFLYYNDKAPTYYTSYDDYTIIFDSYDSDVDTYLTSAKTLAYARTVIPFTMSDNFTPDLDEGQFALLLNEAKSLAWAELKQTSHAKAEQAARRGWVRLERTKHRAAVPDPLDALPNYGRGK
jgi:hypothetical protein